MSSELLQQKNQFDHVKYPIILIQHPYQQITVSPFTINEETNPISTSSKNKLIQPQDKENTIQTPKSHKDHNQFMSLLSKIEIDDNKTQLKHTNTSKTCRFVPLRSNQTTSSQNFQLNEQKTQVEDRKGQEYQDQAQLTLKDLYKKNVWGYNLENSSPPRRILQFEQSQSEQKSYPSNHLLKTYDDLLQFRSKAITQEQRKIQKVPFKVLDAPSLQDDFYLNLIDWSSQNVLAVALSSCVYLWSAANNKVVKFCDFGQDDMVCSLVWSPGGQQLAIGTGQGEIHLFDQVKMKRISILEGHTSRVGSLAWSNQGLCSGSKDKTIRLHDLRSNSLMGKWEGHKQEVCGLKWSPDEYSVASGGNDNKLMVWKVGCDRNISKFSQHQAAVKALAWSPHKHGLLVSGGGTADRTIRFFNTLTNSQVDWIDTGSQVCNLLFSKNINEFVSTHGYSMNQIVCWKYPSLEKVATLTGHSSRVLFLAMSPDGETIVTGAGDETLRFWNVFPKQNSQEQQKSCLFSEYKSIR